MSLTLKDLRVQTQHNLLMTGAANPTRPASLADLVEVLKQEGARLVGIDYGTAAEPFVYTMDATPDDLESGTYLILPLGDTP